MLLHISIISSLQQCSISILESEAIPELRHILLEFESEATNKFADFGIELNEYLLVSLESDSKLLEHTFSPLLSALLWMHANIWQKQSITAHVRTKFLWRKISIPSPRTVHIDNMESPCSLTFNNFYPIHWPYSLLRGSEMLTKCLKTFNQKVLWISLLIGSPQWSSRFVAF